MVFKPFTHLARQSLGKTFTHGYAQSIVAATQSSYASSTTPLNQISNHAAGKIGKHGASQFHTTFQPSSASSSATANSGQPGSVPEDVRGDGSLGAYYEAWQKHQWNNTGGKQWKQFQFPLRIGWKGPNARPDGKGMEKENARFYPEDLRGRGSLDRAYSSSAVDDLKQVEDIAAEAAAVAEVDEAIAEEISTSQIATAFPTNAISHNQASTDINAIGISGAGLSQPGNSASPSEQSPTLTGETVTTPISSASSDAVVQLHNSRRYAEIPAVFEMLLARGIQPSVQAYNGLLAAAVELPITKHQVVSKALSVYTSMLQCKVTPDDAFYTTLLEQLSLRAIEVHHTLREMDVKRRRFLNPTTVRPETSSSFLMQSDESEYMILAEDDAIQNAIKVFDAAVTTTGGRNFSSEIYRLLITACALHGRVEDMLRMHSHMEETLVTPVASMFPPMIEAFAQHGDLRSAVECYNGYKGLAIQCDSGCNTLVDRKDDEVYAAVVKSYARCGRNEAGNRFFSRIVKSFDSNAEAADGRLNAVQDSVITRGLVPHHTEAAEYAEALKIAETQNLSASARNSALVDICIAAADNDDGIAATKAYEAIDSTSSEIPRATLSMLALHIREGHLDKARIFWPVIQQSSNIQLSLIEPTVMYSLALIEGGFITEGLQQARESFTRMRACTDVSNQIKDKIDEAIELIGTFFATCQVVPSPQATMILLRAMSENNGPVSPVSENLLAGLGSLATSTMGWEDLMLLLRTEAAMIISGTFLQDVAHVARFEHIMDLVLPHSTILDEVTVEAIEQTLKALEIHRPDLLTKWQNGRQTPKQPSDSPTMDSPNKSLASFTPVPYPGAYDPYAVTTDHKGSNVIVNILDSPRSRHGANLDEALSRFRNIRRVHRHPRYVVYSKLIAAAAKEGRSTEMFSILGTAWQDVPLLRQYPSVREGWISILDSMVGACLTVGDRTAALQYHQELLQLGSAPTANTFGLYITTLKESAKSLDEANEALDIFGRAQEEGVEPSSFLYNALIGKLGKARRIDLCRMYFTEMQERGIRPTSVTYGTMINAMCRVSDEWQAGKLFDEMESMPNYKPRPAPYNSLMQFFLSTKRDSSKVLEYYSRMLSKNIRPTMHTYKLLIDTYATLEPIDMAAAESVLDDIRASGERPEAVHYASLIHAKGCALQDMAGAWTTFNAAMANPEVRPQACLYQALFEAMVANHRVEETDELLEHMASRGVEMTPYIANTLIHGWATAHNIAKAQAIYERIGTRKREPSTYEAMTRGFIASNERQQAFGVVRELQSRGYPAPVTNKIVGLLSPNGIAPAGHHATAQADQYIKGSLTRDQLCPSPFTQFHTWFTHAREAGVHQPETVCLSTASLPSGRVTSRFVYLKELDDRGFVIYSNWEHSRKAADVRSNPFASLAFWWKDVERQVRVEGPVERLSESESQAYYDLRARGSRIGAWASEQSRVLKEDEGGREVLENRVKDVERKFDGQEKIPVPGFWGGLRIIPETVEFWQGRESRLHDRFRYLRSSHGAMWEIERLSP
ncbi:MAG: hypothetical protein Q9219_002793 [cf. Caloplaca sp. 3 TL-2023]